MGKKSSSILRWALGVLLCALGLSQFGTDTTHATFTVAAVVGNGTPASCTETALRSAIGGGGNVSFNCGGAPLTISVSDDLLISRDTMLDGGGLISLSGGNATRVLQTANYITFTLQNITIRDGKEPGADGSGSGLFGGYRGNVNLINTRFENNDGTAGDKEQGGGAVFVKAGSALYVYNSTFSRNRGVNGGAINNLLSNLTVISSTFIGNSALTLGGLSSQGEGGAIYTDGASEYIGDNLGGAIVIRNSTFLSNTARGQGGALFAWAYSPDVIVLDYNRFLSNTATIDPISNGSALGGALRIGNARAFLSNSLFTYNIARSQGGAFWTEGLQTTLITNVTFAHNRAVSDDATGKGGLGGALAGDGNWTCVNCVIANNQAGFMGGGIFGSGSATLLNSIVAHNTAFNDGNPWNIQQNCSQNVVNGGNNIQFPAKQTNDPNDANCLSSVTFANPLLSALADNGGPTLTMALSASSPAINVGNPATCAPLDQRGYARNGVCDIGAYEFNGAPFNPTKFLYLPLIKR